MEKKIRIFIISGLLCLAACTHDNYAPVGHGRGSQEKLAADLHDCRYQSYTKLHTDSSHSGAVVGGILGGAIGGALGGVIDSSGEAPRPDVNKLIQDCMRLKGYSGTSNDAR